MSFVSNGGGSGGTIAEAGILISPVTSQFEATLQRQLANIQDIQIGVDPVGLDRLQDIAAEIGTVEIEIATNFAGGGDGSDVIDSLQAIVGADIEVDVEADTGTAAGEIEGLVATAESAAPVVTIAGDTQNATLAIESVEQSIVDTSAEVGVDADVTEASLEIQRLDNLAPEATLDIAADASEAVAVTDAAVQRADTATPEITIIGNSTPALDEVDELKGLIDLQRPFIHVYADVKEAEAALSDLDDAQVITLVVDDDSATQDIAATLALADGTEAEMVLLANTDSAVDKINVALAEATNKPATVRVVADTSVTDTALEALSSDVDIQVTAEAQSALDTIANTRSAVDDEPATLVIVGNVDPIRQSLAEVESQIERSSSSISVSAAVDDAIAQVDRITGVENTIVIPVDADTESAAAEVGAFVGSTEGETPVVRVTADESEAISSIAAFADAATRVTATVPVDASTEDAAAEIRQLALFDEQVTVTVTGNTDPAVQEVASLRTQSEDVIVAPVDAETSAAQQTVAAFEASVETDQAVMPVDANVSLAESKIGALSGVTAEASVIVDANTDPSLEAVLAVRATAEEVVTMPVTASTDSAEDEIGVASRDREVLFTGTANLTAVETAINAIGDRSFAVTADTAAALADIDAVSRTRPETVVIPVTADSEDALTAINEAVKTAGNECVKVCADVEKAVSDIALVRQLSAQPVTFDLLVNPAQTFQVLEAVRQVGASPIDISLYGDTANLDLAASASRASAEQDITVDIFGNDDSIDATLGGLTGNPPEVIIPITGNEDEALESIGIVQAAAEGAGAQMDIGADTSAATTAATAAAAGVAGLATSIPVDADTTAAQTKLAGLEAQLGGLVKKFGLLAAGGFGISKLFGIAKDAVIGFNQQVTQASIGFETMLGSAAAAEQQMEELKEFAVRTPFELRGLVSAEQRLLAFGFSAEELLPTLGAIGDAVAGMGGQTYQLELVIRAIGQIRAKGKLSAEEMLQLTEQGIPAWEYLARSIGVTTQEIQAMSRKGLVPAEEAIQALVEGMQQDFGGLMERNSKTLVGAMSNIKDATDQVVGAIGRPLFDAFSDAALAVADFLGVVGEGFSEDGFTGVAVAVREEFGAVGDIVADIIEGVGGFVEEISGIANSIAAVGKTVGVVLGGTVLKAFSLAAKAAGFLADNIGLVQAAFAAWAGLKIAKLIGSIQGRTALLVESTKKNVAAKIQETAVEKTGVIEKQKALTIKKAQEKAEREAAAAAQRSGQVANAAERTKQAGIAQTNALLEQQAVAQTKAATAATSGAATAGAQQLSFGAQPQFTQTDIFDEIDDDVIKVQRSIDTAGDKVTGFGKRMSDMGSKGKAAFAGLARAIDPVTLGITAAIIGITELVGALNDGANAANDYLLETQSLADITTVAGAEMDTLSQKLDTSAQSAFLGIDAWSNMSDAISNGVSELTGGGGAGDDPASIGGVLGDFAGSLLGIGGAIEGISEKWAELMFIMNQDALPEGQEKAFNIFLKVAQDLEGQIEGLIPGFDEIDTYAESIGAAFTVLGVEVTKSGREIEIYTEKYKEQLGLGEEVATALAQFGSAGFAKVLEILGLTEEELKNLAGDAELLEASQDKMRIALEKAIAALRGEKEELEEGEVAMLGYGAATKQASDYMKGFGESRNLLFLNNDAELAATQALYDFEHAGAVTNETLKELIGGVDESIEGWYAHGLATSKAATDEEKAADAKQHVQREIDKLRPKLEALGRQYALTEDEVQILAQAVLGVEGDYEINFRVNTDEIISQIRVIVQALNDPNIQALLSPEQIAASEAQLDVLTAQLSDINSARAEANDFFESTGDATIAVQEEARAAEAARAAEQRRAEAEREAERARREAEQQAKKFWTELGKQAKEAERAAKEFWDAVVKAVTDVSKRVETSLTDISNTLQQRTQQLVQRVDSRPDISQRGFSVGRLIDNASQQRQIVQEFGRGIEQLQKVGLSKEAIEAVGITGPQSIRQIRKLLRATPEEIRELNKQVAGLYTDAQRAAYQEQAKIIGDRVYQAMLDWWQVTGRRGDTVEFTANIAEYRGDPSEIAREIVKELGGVVGRRTY